MKSISVEFRKLKSSKIFLPILILPLLSIIMGSINYYGNIGILEKEWTSLWTQVYLFYGTIFFPVLNGIICAYIWNGEHVHGNIKLLLTSPNGYGNIIMSKTIVALVLNIITQVYFLILFMVSGSLFQFHSAFPFTLLIWMVISSLYSIANIALQLYLSLKIKSFAVPVAISLVLSFLSMVGSTLAKLPFLQNVFASTAVTLAMNHYPEIDLTASNYIWMTICSVILFIVFSQLQKRTLKRQFEN